MYARPIIDEKIFPKKWHVHKTFVPETDRMEHSTRTRISELNSMDSDDVEGLKDNKQEIRGDWG